MPPQPRPPLEMVLLVLQLVFTALVTAVASGAQLHQPDTAKLPNPTHAGYLDVEVNAGSKIYYQYYEADSELQRSPAAAPAFV